MLRELPETLSDRWATHVVVRGSGDGHFDQVETVKLVRLSEATIADRVKSC